MDYLIKNGRIADKNGCYEADLIIKNGKLTYIGDGLDATGLEVIAPPAATFCPDL